MTQESRIRICHKCITQLDLIYDNYVFNKTGQIFCTRCASIITETEKEVGTKENELTIFFSPQQKEKSDSASHIFPVVTVNQLPPIAIPGSLFICPFCSRQEKFLEKLLLLCNNCTGQSYPLMVYEYSIKRNEIGRIVAFLIVDKKYN